MNFQVYVSQFIVVVQILTVQGLMPNSENYITEDELGLGTFPEGNCKYGNHHELFGLHSRDVYCPEDSKVDCSDVLDSTTRIRLVNGIYYLELNGDSPLFVYCDMESEGVGGSRGWTVIQQRTSGAVNFNRTMEEYRDGFGDLYTGNFWLGHEKIWTILISTETAYALRVELSFNLTNETQFAEYGLFEIASGADNYKLTVGNYTGNAENGLGNQNGTEFKVKEDSGWWFNDNPTTNLNGVYTEIEGASGIMWNSKQDIKSAKMMIRRKN